MSFESGRGNNGNNNNKLYEKTYFSRLNFRDYTHNSKTRLGFQYRTGMLIIDLSGEKNDFEYESLEQIFITGAKAKILLDMIKIFEDDIKAGTFEPAKGYGINTGMGDTQTVLILGLESSGEKNITIAKVNKDGNVEKSHKYVFNTDDFHYGLAWNNASNIKSFDRIATKDLEYELFKNTIKTFADNSNGVIAYTVADLTRYDQAAILNKMNPIYDKLGIERQSNSRSGNGFFNNNNNGDRSSEHKSYDDIEDELPFD